MDVGAVTDAIAKYSGKRRRDPYRRGVILRQVLRPGLRPDGNGLPVIAWIARLILWIEIIIPVVVERQSDTLRLVAARRIVPQPGERIFLAHRTFRTDLLGRI